jgi:sugar O-acyltransferase (sialic acid O-acetyltransferase NeuD family)
MKRLLIVGAGGFGREVLAWALDTYTNRNEWEMGGFLDDNPSALQDLEPAYEIIGVPLAHIPQPNDYFVCAIGDPVQKLRLARAMQSRGAQFVTLIHPTAIVGTHCQIGVGCILCPGAVLTTNVVLGDFVTLNLYATVGHDAVLGHGTTLSAHCDVTGCVTLGKGVFLGSHASVMPSKKIGDYAKIGAGSVVVRKVPPRATVMGVPATRIYSPEKGE